MDSKKYFISSSIYQEEDCGSDEEELKDAVKKYIKKQKKDKAKEKGKTYLEYLSLIQWIRSTSLKSDKVAGILYDYFINTFWKVLFYGILSGIIIVLASIAISKAVL